MRLPIGLSLLVALALVACGEEAPPAPDAGLDLFVPDIVTSASRDYGATPPPPDLAPFCPTVASRTPAWVTGARPSTEVYVSPAGDDNNDGSKASPLRTAAKAVKRLGAAVRINFAAGTYDCPGLIENVAASTVAPAILRSSDGPRKAVFECGGKSNFLFSRAHGVILDGLEIAHAAGHGVQLDSGSPFDLNDLSGDFVLMNSYVHDTQLAGIKCAQSERVYVIGNEFARSGAGRQEVEMVAVNLVSLLGNDVHDADAFDEVKGGAKGGIIAFNHIHDMNPGATGILVGGDCTGQQFLLDPKADYEARDLYVWANLITSCDGAAFRIVGCHTCVVAGNTYYSPAPKAILRILHDAFGSPGGNGACDVPLHNRDVRIADNLFSWGKAATYVIASDEDKANVTLDHNLFYMQGGGVTKLGADLPFTGEPTSLYDLDPLLRAPPSDLELTGKSPATAAGVTILGANATAYDGRCRTEPPNIGAY